VCYNMHTQRVLLSLRMSSSRAAQKVTAPELAQFICSCNALDAHALAKTTGCMRSRLSLLRFPLRDLEIAIDLQDFVANSYWSAYLSLF